MGSVGGISKDMGAVSERRRHTRYAGDGLMVWLDGRIYPVVDVSLGGVRLPVTQPVKRGALVGLKLIPCHGEALMLSLAVVVTGQVLATGMAGTRLVFVDGGYSLAKAVVRHARRQCLDGVFNSSVD